MLENEASSNTVQCRSHFQGIRPTSNPDHSVQPYEPRLAEQIAAAATQQQLQQQLATLQAEMTRLQAHMTDMAASNSTILDAVEGRVVARMNDVGPRTSKLATEAAEVSPVSRSI